MSAIIGTKFNQEVGHDRLSKLNNKADSLTGDIFSQVQKFYKRELIDNFTNRIHEGIVDKHF